MDDPLIARADELHDENRRLKAERRSLLERCEQLRAEMRELISKRQMAQRVDLSLSEPRK